MKVTNLASGSKGNCTVVCGNTTNLLVDIGVNLKYLQASLFQVGQNTNNIDALLITHEHSDHTSGLEVFLKNHPYVHVYVYGSVWQEITKIKPSLADYANVHKFEYYLPMSVGEFTVTAMENYHDSVSCASFIITQNNSSLGICTDLGVITEKQIELLGSCKVVYLECNHDVKMLRDCKYPSILKNRISGKFGHLSNEQCAIACGKLARAGTKVIVLSHISENSNLPEVAYSCVMDELSVCGLDNTMVLLSYQKKVGKTITIN